MSQETINGSVERITFQSEETGYTSLRFAVAGYGEPVTVAGIFSSLSPGENLRLTGDWTNHPKYGHQAIPDIFIQHASILKNYRRHLPIPMREQFTKLRSANPFRQTCRILDIDHQNRQTLLS